MKKVQFIILFLSRLLVRYSQGNFKLSSFFKKYFGLVIITVFLITLSIIFWQKYHYGSYISEGIVGVYANNNLPLSVTHLISEPLVVLDKTGYPSPNLVSGWQVNNNATLYTFKLKDGLFWNDGSHLKASDIQFNLPDVEVSYPDDSTIQFKLADSFNPFPALLTTPVFKNNSFIGIGKYQVVSEDQSHGLIVKLVLRPSKSNGNNLPVITIRFYGDEKIAKTAFDLGEVESLLGISEIEEMKNQPSANIKKITNFNKLVAVFYNTKDAILSDKNLRRALSLAIPQIEDEERAKTPIPVYSWAYNDQVKGSIGDPEAAKTYLDKVNNGKENEIILTTTPALSALAEKIVQSWKDIGIKTSLRIESGIPQNFQALLLSQSIPTDPDQYALWHSTQTKTNLSKYSSPRVDKDLEDGRKMGKDEDRKEKYLDFQKVLLDDTPATFLYFPKTNIIYRNRVENNLNRVLDLQIPRL